MDPPNHQSARRSIIVMVCGLAEDLGEELSRRARNHPPRYQNLTSKAAGLSRRI